MSVPGRARRSIISFDSELRRLGQLAHFFGTSAQFWLNLQNLYQSRTGFMAKIVEMRVDLVGPGERLRIQSRAVPT